MIAVIVGIAGVAVAGALGAAHGLRARRARARARSGETEHTVTPAVAYCVVRDAAVIAAAWRAAGLVVVARRGYLDVRTRGGTAARVMAPRSGRFGDAAFAVWSRDLDLVHQLAGIASRELGPLVCAIDGYVHGFDAKTESETRGAATSQAGAQTRVLRPAAAVSAASAVTYVPTNRRG